MARKDKDGPWREFQRLSRLKPPRRTDGGSTMYDRSARETPPSGASGYVNLHATDENGNPTVEGHSTQFYDDGHRVSWDGDGQGDQNEHWTNQNVPRGKRHRDERHAPPSDAR